MEWENRLKFYNDISKKIRTLKKEVENISDQCDRVKYELIDLLDKLQDEFLGQK